jgi:translation initiation factor 4E
MKITRMPLNLSSISIQLRYVSSISFSHIPKSFWACFAAIPQPSAFLQGRTFLVENRPVNSIMIFRGDVAPEWEDPSNAEGGHFQFQWKSAGVSPAQLDEYWNNIILALIGNTIEAEGEFSVCPILQGARFVDKSNASGKLAGVRIEIWFSKPIDARHLQKVRSRLDKAMTTHLDGTTGVNPRCDVRYHSNRQH